ncbi:hypothetical protein VCJ71_11210 [Alteriqipengyuania sp. WL0013]|uniref:hypothetical protein n=1 Tax=Alteriqipengyuania sp. WL0013 TaxID=3110773 RepID=UPI002CB1541A|nr:hypothetical protein [Alteriqipengyuania sp. WL0013]MEB3416638.1 hypothetical protein [Alteriqipengyuania sp. WL0013]
MTIERHPAPNEQSDAREWENEGGAVAAHSSPELPEGVIAITSVSYRVGPYTYARLKDALAEHRRQSTT